MVNKACFALVGLLTFAPELALADSPAARCVDISLPKQAITARNGKWIELTAEQWQFLRGIYAMNPATPPGLPFGDHAVLAQVSGDAGGLVFFIDGGRACTPMAVPGELLAMIRDVATETIAHESGGL